MIPESGAHSGRPPNRQATLQQSRTPASRCRMTRWPLPDPMREALKLAQEAEQAGEVPVGAVVTRNGAIIGRGRNVTRVRHDPTGHAEIVAIREAARLSGSERLTDCEIWVTLEPCAMCAGAISHARLAKLYYAAQDPKGGAVAHGARVFDHPQCLHRPDVYPGLGEAEAGLLLRSFFAARR